MLDSAQRNPAKPCPGTSLPQAQFRRSSGTDFICLDHPGIHSIDIPSLHGVIASSSPLLRRLLSSLHSDPIAVSSLFRGFPLRCLPSPTTLPLVFRASIVSRSSVHSYTPSGL